VCETEDANERAEQLTALVRELADLAAEELDSTFGVSAARLRAALARVREVLGDSALAGSDKPKQGNDDGQKR